MHFSQLVSFVQIVSDTLASIMEQWTSSCLLKLDVVKAHYSVQTLVEVGHLTSIEAPEILSRWLQHLGCYFKSRNLFQSLGEFSQSLEGYFPKIKRFSYTPPHTQIYVRAELWKDLCVAPLNYCLCVFRWLSSNSLSKWLETPPVVCEYNFANLSHL